MFQSICHVWFFSRLHLRHQPHTIHASYQSCKESSTFTFKFVFLLEDGILEFFEKKNDLGVH
jgi:hypothetical protein